MSADSLLVPMSVCCSLFMGGWSVAADVYVSPDGDDSRSGAKSQPMRTLQAARDQVRKHGSGDGKGNTIRLLDGVFYLQEPLVLSPEDSGLTIEAVHAGKAVVSGAQLLSLQWKPFRDGIMQAEAPAGLKADCLFVDGKQLRMARYPNANPEERIFNGYAADAVAPKRVAGWKDPEGGFLHALHGRLWGGHHYIIEGKKPDGSVKLAGGWQNNRPSAPHGKFRFVENVFEELDVPGEWFLDKKEGVLYVYPEAGTDLNKARVEATRLERLLELRGTEEKPVRGVTLKGLVLTQTDRTFMKNREPLLRSDWTIYRNGSVLLAGTEDCTVESCDFKGLGGDAVFVDGYNRKVLVKSCLIEDVGGNGVAFVGDRSAVRCPLDFKDGGRFSWQNLDKTPGPKGNAFPSDCTVEDCLITRTGRVEKQSAPVEIAMSQGIRVLRCSLYDVPRAGINIGDGCWGGHVIDGCDVFDTVLETSDHGSFNSWGRDRFWQLKGLNMNQASEWELIKDAPYLDAVKPTVIRNSRWRCDHGWDIDLDDGSGNYEIYNNLLLARGLKLREGFGRKVHHNVMVNNGLHPHVWYNRSGDVVEYNIFFVDGYFPAGGMPSSPWGERMDKNFVHVLGLAGTRPAAGLQEQSKRDQDSIAGDAMFMAPELGDYRLRKGSPALQFGFKDFPASFGVVSPRLKALAKSPVFPEYKPVVVKKDPNAMQVEPLGVTCRNIRGMGDVSAYGLPGESGVLVLATDSWASFYREGGRADDVIVSVDGKDVRDVNALLSALSGRKSVKLVLIRNQAEKVVSVDL
ncbi:PDZ domain-containing protein [Akkermansia glycaniphila]|uniref:PDZ domain-containing protein n=1 Tax=Akkermansia glycaniphila TaxID=1679444 RepID=UPI001C02F273|nr:PDZ domain-containing protein [Akkermansia glycaniphila]